MFVELGLLPSSLTRSSGVFVGFLCALWVYRTSHEHAVGWFGYIRMPHDVNECVIMCLYGALRLYKWWSVQTHDVWWCFSRNVLDVVNLWHGRTVYCFHLTEACICLLLITIITGVCGLDVLKWLSHIEVFFSFCSLRCVSFPYLTSSPQRECQATCNYASLITWSPSIWHSLTSL